MNVPPKSTWCKSPDRYYVNSYGETVDRYMACETCDGTGEVHSHNPICWTCHGTGFKTTRPEAASQ